MAWITAVQADEFLEPNAGWDEVTNKDEALKLATNRLEQLVFKDEPIDRVGFRYIDGESVSKISGSDDFLLEAEAGNFDYHAALGWTRGNDPLNGLVIYIDPVTLEPNVVFDCPHDEGRSGLFGYEQVLTLKQIQNLHSFGGTFGGTIAVDKDSGEDGVFTSIETKQANAIVDPITGDQVFLSYSNRRINARFEHDSVYVSLSSIEGTTGVTFDGTTVVNVIDKQGNEQSNTVPLILPGEYITYTFEVVDGLDKTMFLVVNGVLVGNPTFNSGGQNQNRLQYSSGTSGASTTRHSYIRKFGSVVNAEVPITIPIRLVGACALLAVEYSKYPPKFVGDKSYLENENDYNRMQDLPINVQAAIEPFLADYESVVDIDGVATTAVRGATPSEDEPKAASLSYDGSSADTPGDAIPDTPDTPDEGKGERGPRGPRGKEGESGLVNFSRLNLFLSLANPYTEVGLLVDTPKKLFINAEAKTVKDFSLDILNTRFFFNSPGVTDRWFKINATTDITTTAVNHEVILEMYKNGVRVEGVGTSRFISAGTDKGNMSASGVTKISHNDYVEMYVTTTKACDITLSRYSMNVMEMVGAI